MREKNILRKALHNVERNVKDRGKFLISKASQLGDGGFTSHLSITMHGIHQQPCKVFKVRGSPYTSQVSQRLLHPSFLATNLCNV